MEPVGTFQIVWWSLIAALVAGGGIYGYIEYHAFLLRTQVSQVPGGWRFTARGLVVESRQATKEVVVETDHGLYSFAPLGGGDEQSQAGAMKVTFAAAGLQMKTAAIVVKRPDDDVPLDTGVSTITFTASDELLCKAQNRTEGKCSKLVLERIPSPIAKDFQQFANRLHLWIDKVEHSIALDLEEQRKKEEQEAKEKEKAEAEAAGAIQDDPSVPLTDEERKARAEIQIAAWRKTAGFKGNTSEVHFDQRGKVTWFIDLEPTGRVILHDGKRTFHGSLKGAAVTSLTGELEVSVRDDYWSEEEPELTVFRVLNGTPPEMRRAWKERLEILIRSLK
jgi:hypothetical protein